MEQDIDPYPAGTVHSPRQNFWRLAKNYWQSNQRFPVVVFLALLFCMTISLIGLDVIFNYYYYYFYDVVQTYDKSGVMRLLLIFVMLTVFYFLFEGYRIGVSYLFGMRLRRRMMQTFVDRWLQKDGGAASQEDVDALINYSFDISMGTIGVMTTFLVLMYVLWQISETITVSLGSWGTLTLPGYLVWAGGLYALGGTYLTFKTGRPLISAGDDANRLMFSMPHVVPQKSIIGGVLERLFPHALPHKIFSRCSLGCYQLSLVLPLIVVLPSYLDKIFLLSWLLQSLDAFNRGQDTLSSLVNFYTRSIKSTNAQTIS